MHAESRLTTELEIHIDIWFEILDFNFTQATIHLLILGFSLFHFLSFSIRNNKKLWWPNKWCPHYTNWKF